VRFEWPGLPDIVFDFDVWLKSLECPDCGAVHRREEYIYEQGKFSVTIVVDLCPKGSAR
jgi:hypothetical protein